jgi:hypothetical protein
MMRRNNRNISRWRAIGRPRFAIWHDDRRQFDDAWTTVRVTSKTAWVAVGYEWPTVMEKAAKAI